MITPADLKEKGYTIADIVSQELITRCEIDIINAYILPILPDYIYPSNPSEEADLDIVNAIFCLTYLLLLSRNVTKTRFGTRQKETTASKAVETNSLEIEQLTITADMYIQKLEAKEEAAVNPQIYDICKIYNLHTLL